MAQQAEAGGYAVFLFPQAIEALGEAIAPFMTDSPMGRHIPCREIDTGGALVQLSVQMQQDDGQVNQMTLMLPVSMVQLVVSRASTSQFGFGPRLPQPLQAQPQPE